MKNLSFDILLNLKDSVSAGVRRISQAMEGLQADCDRTADCARSVDRAFGGISAVGLNAVAEIAQRVGDSFAASAHTGMGFGQAMADLSAITGITGADLERLSAEARRFGRESGLGADTAARAYTVLASQIQVADIGMEGLNTLQEKSITLAQASGMSLDAAAEALAGTVNQFGLGADQAERVINVLAAGSKYGAAEIGELAQSFKVTGASASALGLSVEETAGALEVLSKANLKGSEAGTALRNILLKLTTELGIDLGETSLEAALGALRPKLEDATYLSKLFGAENIAAAQFLIKNAEAVGTMTTQLTGTSTAQEQAAVRTQTTAQKMAELQARVDDVKIGITEMSGSLAPYLVMAAENAAVLTAVASSAGAVWGWMGKLNAAMKAATGLTVAQNAAAAAAAAGHKAVAVATDVWAAAQRGLNLALKNNPIGWLCTIVAALVAGVIYAYQHFEGFRQACDAVWSTAKRMGAILWEAVVKAFDAVTGAARKAWEWVKRFLGLGGGGAEEGTSAVQEQTDAINDNAEARVKAMKLQLPGDPDAPKGSIKWIEQQMSEIRGKLSLEVDPDSRKALSAELKRLEDEKHAIELDMIPDGSVKKLEQRIADLHAQLDLAVDPASRTAIAQELKQLEDEKHVIELELKYTEPPEAPKGGTSLAMEMPDAAKSVPSFKSVQKTSGGIKKNLQDAADAASAIGTAFGSLGDNLNAPALNAAGIVAQAIATIALSYSQAMTAAAGMGPWMWIAFAATGLAQLVSVIAAVKNATAFSEGGIVSGPTMALVGEYAGASNNPEVIAPLNRLRQLIRPAASLEEGQVTFRIKGRTLEGVLQRVGRMDSRS